jgi:predicted nucleotidyltransferase
MQILKPIRKAMYLTDMETIVIRRYISLLQKHFSPYKIVLFGSKATGEAHEESDIDIAIFVRGNYDNKLINDIINTAIGLLLDMNLYGDVFLRPTVIFIEDIEHNKSLLSNIQREGITLWEEKK